MIPYDPISLVVACGAAALFAIAWLRYRPEPGGEESRPRGRLVGAVMLVTLAGGLLRVDGAWQHSLHEWDERFHAVVARNLIEDPLRPTLYRDPAVEYDLRDWTANHVWLHKPPLALWAMAASMSAFGVNEIAMRLPSMLLSTGAIILTFVIGRLLFTDRVGLLAATFHAMNGFLVALASGRRVADHVDTALVFLFELSVLLALGAARSRTRAALCGFAIGLGGLTKSLPALLALAVVFTAIAMTVSWRKAIPKTLAIAAVAGAVAAPWTVYMWWRFPMEAAWESRYTLMHVSQSLEAADGGPLSYLGDLPRFFGELAPVSLALAAWWALRRGAPRALVVAAVWIVVPYVLFSFAATRMPGFVMVAAPAIFLTHAWVWWRLRDRWGTLTGPGRVAMTGLLVVMAVAPSRHLLEPTGVLERRDRRPATVDELRALEARFGGGNVVIFNMPLAIETMFYTPYTAYAWMPTETQVRRLAASGRRVVIYAPAGESTPVHASWPVTYLKGVIPRN